MSINSEEEGWVSVTDVCRRTTVELGSNPNDRKYQVVLPWVTPVTFFMGYIVMGYTIDIALVTLVIIIINNK